MPDDFKIGDKVHYKSNHGTTKNGIVKSISSHRTGGVFVVYHCDNEWDNYQDYTAALTYTDDLEKGWKSN